MSKLNDDFITLFKQLEDVNLGMRNQLNSLSFNGSELETYLEKDLDEFEKTRFDLMDRLGAITKHFTEEEKENHINYVSESEYFEAVQEAPFYWRIINKPNGYAGDAQLMSLIYRNQFEGRTPYGMFNHKNAMNTKACQAVRNRKVYLTQKILAAKGGDVLSLAAGPASEIRELLDVHSDEKGSFLALDHDMDTLRDFDISEREPRFKYALANAFQIIQGNYLTARPRKMMGRFCSPRKDFRGLRVVFSPLKYELRYLEKESFDFVYSSGLYDYIPTFPLDDSKGTVALTKKLFDLVRPGGSMVVGNFSTNNPQDMRFVMEYVCHWELFHRDDQEIIEFTRAIPEGEIDDIRVVKEATGINSFLEIQKKAA